MRDKRQVEHEAASVIFGVRLPALAVFEPSAEGGGMAGPRLGGFGVRRYEWVHMPRRTGGERRHCSHLHCLARDDHCVEEVVDRLGGIKAERVGHPEEQQDD